MKLVCRYAISNTAVGALDASIVCKSVVNTYKDPNTIVQSPAALRDNKVQHSCQVSIAQLRSNVWCQQSNLSRTFQYDCKAAKTIQQQRAKLSRIAPERAIMTHFQTQLALTKFLPGQISILIDGKLQQQHK